MRGGGSSSLSWSSLAAGSSSVQGGPVGASEGSEVERSTMGGCHASSESEAERSTLASDGIDVEFSTLASEGERSTLASEGIEVEFSTLVSEGSEVERSTLGSSGSESAAMVITDSGSASDVRIRLGEDSGDEITATDMLLRMAGGMLKIEKNFSGISLYSS